jgi:hypothetical protein
VVTASTLLVFFVLLKIMVGFLGNRFLGGFQVAIAYIEGCTSDTFNVNKACAILQDVIVISW